MSRAREEAMSKLATVKHVLRSPPFNAEDCAAMVNEAMATLEEIEIRDRREARSSEENVTEFVYLLLGKVPPGVIDAALADVGASPAYRYQNRHLESYARAVADRLVEIR